MATPVPGGVETPPSTSQPPGNGSNVGAGRNQEMYNFAAEKIEAQFHRDERWLNTLARVRAIIVWVLVIITSLVIIACGVAVLYLIVFLVVHYTIPQVDWAEPDQVTKLEGLYSKLALAAAPVALISNAWLIWWFSRPRFGINRTE